ncbi:hypothetical protein A2715_04755 [Candidatus Woesebacteria bacterium RIFCSPHIGHO2_01_FULL_39_32]|uniref:Glycosyltransferase RgtA/B/C/D-like domain-containing protein n=1 Tax=Candidatus Woesebacteria bacterium RIFCSPLOWO2_01_FULL_39_25 TaxID=1802521 RepID=A0A1F8BMG5_9BACT|nr:MAG: hypothetical protein A2124_03290 [Candidatus Woesebacteria bacterium GWB1_37_5]OGM25328.1 MAG: hypothetical protein A2715_04755 [Candidatus Woesebacteria bacterium RIFCSPHIGHO2_01_FULL_39_32]OGM37827.1 MAG: hypothetical protein A3F01_01965 [Candidatus Woesebacteria bacterium RIFCSPHIGHO2_12_FULL_38_11]OGM64859.1 MAG: hypothetical protein A2893_04365 [Candidatus Woesebacteria bacterium RIFCSPLOWO2_01_FULL_39_25]
MNIKKFLIRNSIFLILILAAFLRLWSLSTNPPHLTPDEAALGYNAYSILKTGRDEYGELLPIIFKSFGDFKPGLYVYLTVPFVAIFGLNEWSVRLPSAIAGILAVWFLYKVVLLFFEIRDSQSPITNHQSLAKITALMLAISPWHIHFSRGAWEANVSLTLTLTGIYFFLKALEKSKFLVLSSIFFSLTLLTYQGSKLSTSIVLLVLIVTFWKEVKEWLTIARSHLTKSILVGLIIASPILFSFISGETGRLNVFSVFSYPRPHDYLRTFLDQGNEKVGELSYYLFHSENLNFTRGVMGRWFNHFSGRFLFFEGDWQNLRHSVPNHGMLLLIDLVLLILGLVALIKQKTKFTTFIFLWLILAPLPGALSRDQVHAVRSLNMLVPLLLISSFGLMEVILWIKKFKNKVFTLATCYLLLTTLFLGSLIYYLDSYFVHLPKHGSQLWSYGYKQIVETVTPIQNNYKEVRVQQSFAQPYIYFLFYQKYDPAKYQAGAKLSESEYKGDVGYVTKLDNICFCPIDWSVNRGDHGSLIIGDPIRIPPEDSSDTKLFNVIKEIKYLNGETAFRIVEVK